MSSVPLMASPQAVMIEHGVSGPPVVKPDGFLVGITTEADLVAGVVILKGSVLHQIDRPVMDGVAWSVPGPVSLDDLLIAQEPDPRAAPCLT